jgi:DNA-directed RNA polymerase specialized sigma24 family protein
MQSVLGAHHEDEPDPITRCLRDLEGGDLGRRDDAVRELWEHFFADLTTYARSRLRVINVPRGPADEEDAAVRAFTKVCLGIERGRLKLGDGMDLSRILRSATAREVINLYHKARRGAGWTSDESLLEQIPDTALRPELLWLGQDACQWLLDLLPTDELRQIVLWKLAGHTNESIRINLACSLGKVERDLARIREIWKGHRAEGVPDGPAKPGPRQTSAGAKDCPRDGESGRRHAGAPRRILRSLSGVVR